MELTTKDWEFIKFLATEKGWKLLPNVLNALESGLHFVGIEKKGKDVDFIFE